MITFPLPKESLIIGGDVSFNAVFNTAGDGKYTFTGATNAAKDIIRIQPNTLYFIDTMAIGGDIPAEDFVGAIDSFCYIQFLKKQANLQVYQTPLPINLYSDARPITAWVQTDKDNDYLQGTFTGTLRQTSALVGISSISILISLSLYAINDTNYIAAWKRKTNVEGLRYF